MRALAATETATGADQEIVVTLLRSVGWLSRFDLRSRTTGAGPMLETPEAQCRGPQSYDLALALGEAVGTDTGLARRAAAVRTPLRAWQLRPGTTAEPAPGAIRVDGALLAALKPAENGDGLVLRLTNPTPETGEARVHAPADTLLTPVRLDEEPTGQNAVRQGVTQSVWPLAPFTTLTLRIGERP
ncbi:MULTISPECIES: hypothetical protein [unclassified Streptomyces]|uniref:glycosyl hydrolase-related protein n=1 Tax=unclassified Streptomyces TaxID=2593676 RepID=UPI0024A7D377|nr:MULTISPECIES: hypothetical protein [unclassified Streptomyces]